MTDGQAKPVETPDAGTMQFTPEQQAHVNKIVAERLSRQQAQYAGYDTLKEEHARLLAEKQQREESEKSERQKEVERIAKETEKRLRGEFDGERKSWQVERAIERELNVQGITDPDVARLLAGEYAVTTADEAKDKVAALLIAKPYLKPPTNQRAQGIGGTPAAGAGSGASGIMRTTNARINDLRARDKWVGSEEQKAYEAGRLEVTD